MTQNRAVLSPLSPQKKRALGDRTNNTATEGAPAAGGKAKAKARGLVAAGTPGVQPAAAAAERRAASRALIDGESAINDESAGGCNQS